MDQKKNTGGRTSEGHHLDVVTGHELDVHRLPQSSRVWGPPDLTSASLIVDMSGIRNRRGGISQDSQCQGQNESRESATRKHWKKNFLRCGILRWRERKKLTSSTNKKFVEGLSADSEGKERPVEGSDWRSELKERRGHCRPVERTAQHEVGQQLELK